MESEGIAQTTVRAVVEGPQSQIVADCGRGSRFPACVQTAAGDGRLVPIGGDILVVLKEWRARFPKAQPGHYVFPAEAYSASTSASGAVHHIDPTKPIKSWKTAWTTARKLAGVDCRWHDGRHCFISALAGSGVPDSVIMSLAGHVEVEVMRLYSHTGNAAKRAAVAVFENQAFPATTQKSPGRDEPPSTTVQ
jgi:integrase